MHVGYDNKKAEYDINDVKLECVWNEKDGCHYKQWFQVGEAM